jgi:hypothetical protein
MVDRKAGANDGSIGKLPDQFDQFTHRHGHSKGSVYVAENRGQRVYKFRTAAGDTAVMHIQRPIVVRAGGRTTNPFITES